MRGLVVAEGGFLRSQEQEEGEYPHPNPLPGRERGKR